MGTFATFPKAAEPSKNQTAPVFVQDTPGADVLDHVLQALRAREKEAAFSFVAKDRQQGYGGTARAFMNFVRLHYHAIYDHTGYHVLSASQPSRGIMIQKIKLDSRSGDQHLAIIRLVQDANGDWRLHSMAVLPDDDGWDL